MLLYRCFNIDISGPQMQYLKPFSKFSRGAELLPLRASRTLSFPQRTISESVALMQMRREVVQGGGWGCGPEQLAATVPCAPITVDVSQWRGAHSLWQCSVNILEHSGCSGGSPGALHLNNILYMDIYQIIYIITTKSWASRRYYESQTTTLGSLTLWFFHVHINLK